MDRNDVCHADKKKRVRFIGVKKSCLPTLRNGCRIVDGMFFATTSFFVNSKCVQSDLHPVLSEAGSLSDGDDKELAQRPKNERTGREKTFKELAGVVVPACSLKDTTNGKLLSTIKNIADGWSAYCLVCCLGPNQAAGGASCLRFQTNGRQFDSRSVQSTKFHLSTLTVLPRYVHRPCQLCGSISQI